MGLLGAFGGGDFWSEFAQIMLQPLLLFFYAGFLIPILKFPVSSPRSPTKVCFSDCWRSSPGTGARSWPFVICLGQALSLLELTRPK
jgi:hypothetical protein